MMTRADDSENIEISIYYFYFLKTNWIYLLVPLKESGWLSKNTFLSLSLPFLNHLIALSVVHIMTYKAMKQKSVSHKLKGVEV